MKKSLLALVFAIGLIGGAPVAAHGFFSKAWEDLGKPLRDHKGKILGLYGACATAVAIILAKANREAKAAFEKAKREKEAAEAKLEQEGTQSQEEHRLCCLPEEVTRWIRYEKEGM